MSVLCKVDCCTGTWDRNLASSCRDRVVQRKMEGYSGAHRVSIESLLSGCRSSLPTLSEGL